MPRPETVLKRIAKQKARIKEEQAHLEWLEGRLIDSYSILDAPLYGVLRVPVSNATMNNLFNKDAS